MTEALQSVGGLLEFLRDESPVITGRQPVGGLTPEKVLRYREVRARERAYRTFTIPKRSGGERTITAPTGDLKDIQSCIAALLAGAFAPHPAAHGFARGRSVLTGALPHVGHGTVFNTDLKDFFPSIGAPKAEGALCAAGVEPLTAQLISTICSVPVRDGGGRVRNVLPQGSPASPALSNIVCMAMDRRLQGLAERFSLTYTRYADDITFSGDVPRRLFAPDGAFMRALSAIAADNGFAPNPRKTRVTCGEGRREVTGLTVGEKANVPRRFAKNLRAAVHQLEDGPVDWDALRSVEGRLAYMRMVRGKDDPAVGSLHARVRQVRSDWRKAARKDA